MNLQTSILVLINIKLTKNTLTHLINVECKNEESEYVSPIFTVKSQMEVQDKIYFKFKKSE